MLSNILGKLSRKPSFDAVIEGTYHDEWNTLNYKLARLNVPSNVGTLKTGGYVFPLYGVAENFQNVKKTTSSSPVEINIDSLEMCNGVTLPYQGGERSQFIERPRSVYLIDGRIFIEKNMRYEPGYLDAVPKIVENSGKLFRNEGYRKLFTQVVKQ